MTYYREEWNVYVAQFLMKEAVKDSDGLLLREQHHLTVKLFRFENPEEAYERIIDMITENILSDSYRDEHGNVVQCLCLGLNQLDLLQTNSLDMKNDLDKREMIDVTSVDLDFTELSSLITRKENLHLFDENYNFKKED